MLELIGGIVIGLIIGQLLSIKKDKTAEKLVEFIDKNINERVIYPDTTSSDMPYYSNEHKFEKKDEEKKEVEEFEMPEDLTADELREQMEGQKK